MLPLPLINFVIRNTVKRHLASVKTPQKARSSLERSTALLNPLLPRMRISQETLIGPGGPLEVEWISNAASDRRRVIIYMHGGAYIVGSPRTHRRVTLPLAKASGMRVMVPDYRLAPEHPAPAAAEDCVAAYSALLKRGYEPEQIAFAGDSAGGGLVFAALLLGQRRGFPAPAAIVAYSPWVDLTMSSRSVARNAPHDPMLPAARAGETVRYYIGDGDARDPIISPIFGEFVSPPPTYISVGTTEILHDDALGIKARLRNAGAEVTFAEIKDGPHVLPFFAMVSAQGRKVLNDSADFLRERFESLGR